MKKVTLRQMATELNTYYKEKGTMWQISFVGRKAFLVDYSIVATRKEYGIAPIYLDALENNVLRIHYSQMKKGF